MSVSKISSSALTKTIQNFFEEDDLNRNFFYLNSLPNEVVNCSLKLKSDLVLSGLPYFVEAFRYLGATFNSEKLEAHEGKKFKNGSSIEFDFKLPFSVAVTGERIALNLLQYSSSISTFTNLFVEKAQRYNIAILDTRKTTPGLRALEKYAVRVGGGHNHRFGQSDMWMVKDNHKTFFGGIEEAVKFFKAMQGFYTPIEVEVHSLEELSQALSLNIKHIMLDNFSVDLVKEAVKLKTADVTFEISGGINFQTIDQYFIKGVDAISIGALTYNAPHVDISFKYSR